MTRVVFIGGPQDGLHAELSKTPPAVLVGGLAYRRLDDPDTGEFLGGYFVSEVFTPFVPAEFAIEEGTMIPCNRKPGPRDADGHGWVTTMFGIRWHWRCFYCRKRSRSVERPDVKGPLPW